ncbi:hypothetical protein MRX96_050222 [Rhipicephalus microplus]
MLCGDTNVISSTHASAHKVGLSSVQNLEGFLKDDICSGSAPSTTTVSTSGSMVTVEVPAEEKKYVPGEQLKEAGWKRSKICWYARRSWPQWCPRSSDALCQHNIPAGYL